MDKLNYCSRSNIWYNRHVNILKHINLLSQLCKRPSPAPHELWSWFFSFSFSISCLNDVFLSNYRVSQVSCNIKNRHISASKSSNQFLKKDLKRSWSALFACKISWQSEHLSRDHISLKYTSDFWPCLFLVFYFLLYLEVAVFNCFTFFNQLS